MHDYLDNPSFRTDNRTGWIGVQNVPLILSEPLVVLFVNTVTHRDHRGARSTMRQKRAYQVYVRAEQHGAAGCIGH